MAEVLTAQGLDVPRVGLFATVPLEPFDEADLRWATSLGWSVPSACPSGRNVDPCAVGTAVHASRSFVSGRAWYVEVAERCSTLSTDVDEELTRVRQQLLAVSSKLVASELLTGAVARAAGWQNRYLAHIDSDVVTSAAATPAEALACLEQAIASATPNGVGLVHASRQVATAWAAEHLLVQDGGVLTTLLGTPVVVDAGYDGSGPQLVPGGPPQPPATGAIWAYATSPMRVLLGPVEELTFVDRQPNDVTAVARRLVAVVWDTCCHAAAQINLPLCGIGGS